MHTEEAPIINHHQQQVYTIESLHSSPASVPATSLPLNHSSRNSSTVADFSFGTNGLKRSSIKGSNNSDRRSKLSPRSTSHSKIAPLLPSTSPIAQPSFPRPTTSTNYIFPMECFASTSASAGITGPSLQQAFQLDPTAAAAAATELGLFDGMDSDLLNLGTTTTLSAAELEQYSQTDSNISQKLGILLNPFAKFDTHEAGIYSSLTSIKGGAIFSSSPPAVQSLDEIMSSIQCLSEGDTAPYGMMEDGQSSLTTESHSPSVTQCWSPDDALESHQDSSSADSNPMRRSAHVAAEQKRRNNIKAGFDEIQELIPTCQKHSTRLSKATVLRKAIDYISYLVKEKTSLLDEVDRLRKEVCALKLIIKKYQQLGYLNEHDLKAFATLTGTKNGGDCSSSAASTSDSIAASANVDASSASSSTGGVKLPFTSGSVSDSIKFYIFCNVVDLLFESFSAKVSLESPEAFATSIMAWFDEYCRPESLRESFLASLRNLGTKFFTEESMQRMRRWTDGISACTERVTCKLEYMNVPMVQKLGETICGVASLFHSSSSASKRKV